jgi:anthranilate phosphoribosyltransferase
MTSLKKVLEGKSLTKSEAKEVMDEIVDRAHSAEDIGAFLLALRRKGETIDEISGFAESLRNHARPINIRRQDLIDTCGTGGDGGLTFNISTAVAFVVGSSGLGVAKHGNRSVSSRSGSADVYEALGLKIEADENKIARSIDENGFGFLYAPHFHPAMGAVSPIRKSLGVRTVFNLLGPLVNPAKVKKQVIGVYDSSLLEKLGGVLMELGVTEALLVSSRDKLDEISLADLTYAVHLKDKKLTKIEITPEDAGLTRSSLDSLKGGTAEDNAKIIEGIFRGDKSPHLDVVLLNAGAALWIGGLAINLKDGVSKARELINKGLVTKLLETLRKNQ